MASISPFIPNAPSPSCRRGRLNDVREHVMLNQRLNELEHSMVRSMDRLNEVRELKTRVLKADSVDELIGVQRSMSQAGNLPGCDVFLESLYENSGRPLVRRNTVCFGDKHKDQLSAKNMNVHNQGNRSRSAVPLKEYVNNFNEQESYQNMKENFNNNITEDCKPRRRWSKPHPPSEIRKPSIEDEEVPQQSEQLQQLRRKRLHFTTSVTSSVESMPDDNMEDTDDDYIIEENCSEISDAHTYTPEKSVFFALNNSNYSNEEGEGEEEEEREESRYLGHGSPRKEMDNDMDTSWRPQSTIPPRNPKANVLRVSQCSTFTDSDERFSTRASVVGGIPMNQQENEHNAMIDYDDVNNDAINMNDNDGWKTGDMAGYASVVNSEWVSGPTSNEAPRVCNMSDRPLLCLAAHDSLCAVGSSDHTIKITNTYNGKFVTELRQIGGQGTGHSDWVTCVDFTTKGRVISGSMDNKVCLWKTTASSRAIDLLGHSSSVSAVRAYENSHALSASYDKTLILWELQSKKAMVTLSGHSGPVLGFDWRNQDRETAFGKELVSVGRDGIALLWNVQATSLLSRWRVSPQNHTSEVVWSPYSPYLFAAARQDGIVGMYDVRSKRCIRETQVHDGAITAVKFAPPAAGLEALITCGSDYAVKALTPHGSLETLLDLPGHGSPVFALGICPNQPVVVSGGSDGLILAHSLLTGCVLATLGHGQAVNALRNVQFEGNVMIITGDDGNILCWDF